MIYLAANTDAIDASVATKAHAVRHAVSLLGLRIERCAAIGDSVGDLPVLAIEELALRGAPANAQGSVKNVISAMPRTFIASRELLAGFVEFYEAAARSAVDHIFADKDGVLTCGTITGAQVAVLQPLFARMGEPGRPTISVLTGASAEQALDFVDQARLTEHIRKNAWTRLHPQLLLAENGMVWMDILSRQAVVQAWGTSLVPGGAFPDAFRSRLVARLAEATLPTFGFGWASSREDQNAKVHVPAKKTMVTVNVPRAVGGVRDYRRAPEANGFREAVLEAMLVTAGELELPCEVIGAPTQEHPSSRP